MYAAFLSIIVHVAMPGLMQRVFLCLFLLWLSIVVHRLVRVTRGAPSEFKPTENAARG
jgi:hypothetical protein